MAFKTRVIPTSDADVDPIFQATRVEEFNGLILTPMDIAS